MRLVGRPIEVYNYLEPLYNDYRKLRMQNQDGGYALSYVDEVIDQMLTQEYLFDIALPRLPHRCVATFFVQYNRASCALYMPASAGCMSLPSQIRTNLDVQNTDVQSLAVITVWLLLIIACLKFIASYLINSLLAGSHLSV